MSVEEAQEHRLNLMDQKTRKSEAKSWEKWYYSSCEH